MLFKSDKLGISVAQFTKFIYDSIEYMFVNSKLSANAFWMTSKELNHPHLTSKHRSMSGLFKVMRSDNYCNIENNDPNDEGKQTSYVLSSLVPSKSLLICMLCWIHSER